MEPIQKIKSNLSKIIKVLRRGILGLYSYIRKFISWRSHTSTDLSNSFVLPITNANRSSHSSSISSYIRSLRNIRIAGLASSFMFGLLALAIIIPLYNVSGTEDTEAASNYVASTSSITFTSTRNKATINLTPTGTTGTFVQSDTTNTSEVASFNVTTDNATGYTLGIASSTNTTSLTNGTDTLPTISTTSGITAATFNTSNYNDMWGYLPSKYNSTANTGSSAKFYPMTTETTTLDETTAANATTANTYTIALGARVTMAKSSGTYTTPTGTVFILTAVGKPASYSITYNQNTTDSVSNLSGPTGVQSTSAHSIALSSDIPTRTGYDFLGWCTKQTSDQTTQSDGSTVCTNAGGTYYTAGGTFHIDETTTNITTLYAIWYLKDITVTGIFGGDGVTGITFTHDTYDDKSITTNNGTTTLKYGASYTITGSYSSGYEFSSWSATDGTLGSTTTASTTYSTTNVATLTLTGTANTYSLAVTFAGSGVSSVQVRTASGTGGTLMGTVSSSGSSVSGLAYNSTYYLYPVFSSGNEFSSWSNTGSYGTLSSTSTSNPTFTMGAGNGAVTITGKSSKLWFQNATSANCGSTMYDNRGNDTYKNIAYTTAKIGSLCWMTRNLDLPGGTTLSQSDSNLNGSTTSYTLRASSTSGFGNNYTTGWVYNSGRTACSSNSSTGSCYSYYSYAAATAGTNPSSGAASSDICPKGWRLPTKAEFDTLRSTYNTGAKLFASPFYGVYSGSYYKGSFYGGGSNGPYWSSTVRDAYNAYYLSFDSSSASTYNSDKYSGSAVRCVAKS